MKFLYSGTSRIGSSIGGEITADAQDVLQVVGPGIEATLVGQLGGELKANISRYSLVNQFISKRLGKSARAGSFGLSKVALSIAEMDFDELMKSEGLSFDVCDMIFDFR